LSADDCELDTCVLVRRSSVGGRLTARDSFSLGGEIRAKSVDLHNVFADTRVVALSTAKLRLCTVAGGVRCEKEPFVLRDSIVSQVEAVQGDAQIEHCNVFGKGYLLLAKPGKGCFKGDPQFRNPKIFDYRLKTTSPCRGKASDGGDIGVRYTPEMIEILEKALELRKKGVIKF